QQHRGNGAQQDLHIEPRRPVLRIVQVEVNHLVERQVASPVHLPQPGQAGPHQEPLLLPLLILLDLARQGRAWPDEAHIAPQDIDQLRQLVETELPQVFPDAGQARIVRVLEDPSVTTDGPDQLRPLLVRIGDHASELDHAERPAILPEPGLEVEGTTFGVSPDKPGDDQHRKRQDDERTRRDQDVERALHDRVPATDRRIAHADRGNAIDLGHVNAVHRDLQQVRHNPELDDGFATLMNHLLDLGRRSPAADDDDLIHLVTFHQVADFVDIAQAWGGKDTVLRPDVDTVFRSRIGDVPNETVPEIDLPKDGLHEPPGILAIADDEDAVDADPLPQQGRAERSG